MIRSSTVLRDVSAAGAAVVLALSVGLSAAGPARADDGGTTLPCVPVVCPSDAAEETPKPEDPGKGKPTETPAPAVPPVIETPAPAPPPAPAAPAPAPVPTVAPEPSATPAEETASAAPSTTPSPSPSSATPSTESNWNKPITRSAKPTQAAAVSRNDGGSGLFGSSGLLAIMAGVLLLGLAGLAFAWWSRNRLSSH